MNSDKFDEAVGNIAYIILVVFVIAFFSALVIIPIIGTLSQILQK